MYNVTKLQFFDEENGYTDFIMFSVRCYHVKTLPSHFEQHDSSIKLLGFSPVDGIWGFRRSLEVYRFCNVQHKPIFSPFIV